MLIYSLDDDFKQFYIKEFTYVYILNIFDNLTYIYIYHILYNNVGTVKHICVIYIYKKLAMIQILCKIEKTTIKNI